MIQLSDAAVVVNNEAVAVIPNTVKFTEGFGEQKMRAASIGDGKVEQIFSNDVETSFSKIMFEVPTTVDNISLVRSWKALQNGNVVSIAGTNSEGTITRTFQKAAILGDYEVEIGSEASISVEMSSSAAF
jgi:hypothetical protein